MASRTIVDRLSEKIQTGFGCWKWTASTVNSGYGKIYWNGKLELAHRVMYSVYWDVDIPAGFVVDHECHNWDTSCRGRGADCPHKLCVNPFHLEVKTPEENKAAGRPHPWSEKTHCPQGHALIGDNVYDLRTWGRRCRTCNIEAGRRYRKRNNA